MKYKGLQEDCILIVRECGTYLLSVNDIENNESTKTIYDYFMEQESANYYFINMIKIQSS